MGFELTILVVIGTDCKGNCKSNYHTIMTTTATWLKTSIIVVYDMYRQSTTEQGHVHNPQCLLCKGRFPYIRLTSSYLIIANKHNSTPTYPDKLVFVCKNLILWWEKSSLPLKWWVL